VAEAAAGEVVVGYFHYERAGAFCASCLGGSRQNPEVQSQSQPKELSVMRRLDGSCHNAMFRD